jgi:PhzF family phenazine biosynthesis protein
MRLPIFQVDAFADRVFAGNPAAVVPLPRWLPDETLLNIAAENNLSETAFLVNGEHGMEIRWFTPTVEVPLCGHATLAAGFVCFNSLNAPGDSLTFSSASGPLKVRKDGALLELDFPAVPCQQIPTPNLLSEALGTSVLETHRGNNIMAVLESEEQVRRLTPEISKLSKIESPGVLVTAPGTDVDFVSRYFAPRCGIPEDPVTGSTHCQLTPYWASRFGKNCLTAKQVSPRGGRLKCTLAGDRVLIAGEVKPYLVGEILLAD